MKETNRCLVLFAVAGLLLTVPAFAGNESDASTTAIQLKSDELPQSTVVRAFFVQLSSYSDPTAPRCQNYLSRLGLEPDDPAVEELLSAASEVRELFEKQESQGSDADPRQRDDESRWNDTREMGRVFGDLLSSLSGIGYPIDHLESFLETSVRPGIMTMASGPGAVERMREQDQIFGDEVRSIYPAWGVQ